jgi:hypothetical protein
MRERSHCSKHFTLRGCDLLSQSHAKSRKTIAISRGVAYDASMSTGMDLRLERTAARVKLQDVAARMGRHPATLHRWELSAVVTAPRAAEYRRALAACIEDAATPLAA